MIRRKGWRFNSFLTHNIVLLYQLRDLLRLITDESLQILDLKRFLLSNKLIYSLNNLDFRQKKFTLIFEPPLKTKLLSS